jgi:hypothetical protein
MDQSINRSGEVAAASTTDRQDASDSQEVQQLLAARG